MKVYFNENYLKEQIKTKSCKEIAELHNVSSKTIMRHLSKFGLTNPSRKWTKGELKILKKGYFEDRKFFYKFKDRSLSSIYHKASRCNFRRLVKPLRYNIYEAFFNKWSKEFAYFLGFFMADGYISTKKKTVSIKLQNRDVHILNKFLKLFKTDRSLVYENGYPAIKINNALILKRLVELGCKPGSSLENSYPDEMPDEYFFHYLRGYIDGDGSVYISKSKKSRQKNVLRVSILGSKEFLECIVRKLGIFLNIKIKYSICRDKRTILPLHRVTFNGENARLLCYELYRGCEELCLERKREKFKTYLINRE